MNALANEQVGEYVAAQFVAAYQKVGTFQKNGNTKNGGNVASYFCRPDGTVLHVVPGPVDGDTFLREARWAVDVDQATALEAGDDVFAQKLHLRRAHAVRYFAEHRGRAGATKPLRSLVPDDVDARMPKALPNGVGPLGQAHWLLWSDPLPKLAAVYKTVWRDILKERVTDEPVRGR
ncbi:MAG TPA: hypothetical protein VKD90_02445 [Gemmataceae bacterium]|nr:hypothetical protein [Gemmataceae bacterium]